MEKIKRCRGELSRTLERMNAKQRSMLLEMAELILNF